MLKTSILTVIRELYPIKIFIYTTTYDTMINKFKKYNNYIIIKKYSPNETDISNQNETPTYSLIERNIKVCEKEDCKKFNFHNVIGHSRIFIIPRLMEEHKESVLYMDNDTGINLGMGKRFIEHVAYKHVPILSHPECCYIEDVTKTYYNVDVPDYIKVKSNIYKFKYHKVVNNGIEFYPYNELSKHILYERIDVYSTLNNIQKTHFNDMYSISLVITRLFGESEKNVFIKDSPFIINRETRHESEYFITHYCFDKWHNKKSRVHEFMFVVEDIIWYIYKTLQNVILLNDNTISKNISDVGFQTRIMNDIIKYKNTCADIIDFYNIEIPSFYLLFFPPHVVRKYQLFGQ